VKIAFFLTPKAEVSWVWTTSTMRQAVERMEFHRYTAVPLLTPEGAYAGTLAEGDLLVFWKQHPQLRFEDTERVLVAEVPRRTDARAIEIDAEIEQLFALVLDQSFVPVVDDRGAFIGIVKRRSVLAFFHDQMIAWLREPTL
jgi:CBS-domain-containing membrane protein